MKSIKYYLLGSIFLWFVFGLDGHAQVKTFKADLPNFSQVNANFYRGGQPSEAGVSELARRGIKTIINLRGADKHSAAEEVWARNAGIKVINYNLNNWLKPEKTEIEKIIADIEKTENQPVFIHCKRGADRTGTVVAVYRISRDDWTAKQATDEAKKFGFGWWQFWMKDYINDYFKDFTSAK